MGMRALLLGAFLALAAHLPAGAQCAGTDLLAADPALAAEMAAHRDEAVPNRQGRFWKVDRWGVRPSYLIGTFHDSEAAERAITPAMAEVLAGADRLVVEITAAEQAALAARMATEADFAFDASAPPLAGRIDPALLPRFEELLAERGLALEVVNYMRPWLLFAVLGVPVCQVEAMAAGRPMMDELLVSDAAAAGRPVLGLETHEEMLSAFGRVSGEDVGAMIDDMLRTFVLLDEEDLRRTSLELYLAGETMAIWELSQAMGDRLGSDPALRERAATVMWEDLLVGRNRAWAPALLAAVAEGNSVVAVGALHLPGEEGLVEILRRDGWTVTRLD